MQSATSPKKPSPLSYTSPRTSPFKRADSTGAATATRGSPRAAASSTPAPSSPAVSAIWSPRSPAQQPPQQPQQQQQYYPQSNGRPMSSGGKSGDPLSKLHPSQLREMRESFQVLDKNNDGQVTKQDIDDMLNQLGPDYSAGSHQFFGAATGPSINLSTYLHTLSSLLAPLSRPDELNAAFEAFDVDDSGQIDAADLKDALLHSSPENGGRRMTEAEIDAVIAEFSGRRAFKKGMGDMSKPRGQVFRYGDFVDAIIGGGKAAAGAEEIPA